MDTVRAVAHFLDVALMWGMAFAQLVTVVPLVLLLVGMPCVALVVWFTSLFRQS